MGVGESHILSSFFGGGLIWAVMKVVMMSVVLICSGHRLPPRSCNLGLRDAVQMLLLAPPLGQPLLQLQLSSILFG